MGSHGHSPQPTGLGRAAVLKRRRIVMSKIELYGSALCPFVQRVRLVLAEKALEAAEIEIDPRNKPADFLTISPAGKIPLVIHNGAR
jgi:glutathione S-transferase